MKKFAIIGCAHIHTPGFVKKFQARQDSVVTSVWDHDSVRAKKTADVLGARVAGSYTEILKDAEIDGVVVCNETIDHEKVVLDIAKAKKHLFVEKPLGFSSVDAAKMAKAVEKAGVIFQTGYFMRGNAVNLFLKEEIKKGSFGKITRLRLSNCHQGSLGGWFDTEWKWMTDPKISGCGAFGDLGTHVLDILLWFMDGLGKDGQLKKVTASVASATGRYGKVDEYGEGMLEFVGGAVATLAAGWVDVANPVQLILSGTEGHATVVNGEFYFQSKHVEGADGKSPWKKLPEGLPHAFDLFLDAVGGDQKAALVGVHEASRRNVVMEAMYLGAKKSQWIKTK
jgi:predicted dehydrogenase